MNDRLLIGRSAEVARLREAAGPGGAPAGRALVVLGEPGTGKSALLGDLGAYAGARGQRVLSAAGHEHESGLAFGGLQQLLQPVLIDLLAASGQGVGDLLAALGVPSGACYRPAPGRFPAGDGLAQVLAGQATARDGALVLVDDAQWMDSESLELLAFAARRLAGQRVAIVLASRAMPVPGPGHDIPVLQVGPLSVPDASQLLDAQPCPPPGRVRAQVLTQAEGNPLALIELARVVSAQDTARCWAGLPLPLTDRLRAVFAAGLGSLPAGTRQALLLAAAAGDADRDALPGAPGLDLAALGPAEDLGLITVDKAGVRFRHPLIGSALYHDAGFAHRAAAHRQLAALLSGEPDRRAWHLGAAAMRPDEGISSMLTASAPGARRRGDGLAAALALERAAELSPDPDSKARRLAAAAELAAGSGQTSWARDLAGHALPLTRDQGLRSRARYVTGWALAWSGRYGSGATALLSLARETAQGDPATAWNCLSMAAAAAYQSGAPADVAAVAGLLDRLPPGGDGDIAASRLWTLAVTGQAAPARALLARLTGTANGHRALFHAGAAAWLLDQTPVATGLLGSARDTLADPGARAADGGLLAPLGWAYLDAGRWDDALELAGAAQGCPVTDVPPAAARLITATVEAARGNTRRARALVAAGLAADPEHGRLLTARAWHALGLCDLADGDYPAALGHLRRLFDDDGNPYHYHASYLAVADLALAAARAGSRPDGRETLKRVTEALAGTGPGPSPRLRQLTARADAILADPATPDAYPDAIPGDPSWGQWPFEHAQLRLELGERLRRRRRINAAKPELEAALEVFRSLRAGPWAQRAEAELRACGVAVAGNPRSATGLQELTAQQREIVCLAAQGLSNREIGERLFLSPRTVSSHLYRSYPKLGVATRYQLQGLLAQAGSQGC